LTTKIFTAKNRLNGGGKFLEAFKVNDVFEISLLAMELLEESLNKLIVKDYLEANKDGITDMKQIYTNKVQSSIIQQLNIN
jgi:hypothetical protein